MAVKIGYSFSSVFTSPSSPFQSMKTRTVSAIPRVFMWRFVPERLRNDKVVRSHHFVPEKLKVLRSSSRRQFSFFAAAEDQLADSELEEDDSEQESEHPGDEFVASVSSSNVHMEGAGGKPGVLSFYNRPYRREEEILVPAAEKNQNILLWFVGPAVLVASFIFPSLYLRRILSTIFEDSLLTDFLILFFTEALFYCGVAVFLLLIDRLRRPLELVSSDRKIIPPLGYRISSIAVLALSLIIPMVTMGFVWPWTGPAASATLAPYLVGIVVQFAFEQYARYIDSPSWSVIPIIFQVYRLHQLNRAAQLVTALSLTVRGAEMTAQNLAINGSLSTLLNVLQFLGVICIWSLSSFIMRFFPSATMAEG
ncbi:uncharacterized protein LOC107815068 [Nicotiana tabacum]|uniref:Uncharacterized protein LOC107815068 n=2 Tax=Nicotiana TaxID=4085 RepID=A0A1S4C4T5_TOBAC|nr:PREDICTED: uncharacterized protein LOC104217840 [Nicotiana sylvestris]XP_016496068.1 PREDICTED: uncharacterized protein LOC107815068 [Nicotiana tabacum]